MNIWLKNTSGQPSASLTMATVGFAVVTLWLLVSIFAKVGHIEIRPFDGASAMGYLAPLLMLYFGRRHTDGKTTLDTETPVVIKATTQVEIPSGSQPESTT